MTSRKQMSIAARPVKVARPANTTIAQVLDAFLADQKARLRPKTFERYEAVVQLLRMHLDGYAYDTLTGAETALFQRSYNTVGSGHREYSDLFGPEKILEHIGAFTGWFMIRKVLAGEDLLAAAATVTRKLLAWLAKRGYLPEDAGGEVELRSRSARDLPRARRAARLLRDYPDALDLAPDTLGTGNYLDFDHFTIARVEPGRVWLAVWNGRGMRERGPIPVPEAATSLLRPGWTISCALGRIGKTWRLIEVANVYPD